MSEHVEKLAAVVRKVAASTGTALDETGEGMVLTLALPTGEQKVLATVIPHPTFGEVAAFLSIVGKPPAGLSAIDIMKANSEMVWAKVVLHNGFLAIGAFQPPETITPNEVVEIIKEVGISAEKYQQMLS